LPLDGVVTKVSIVRLIATRSACVSRAAKAAGAPSRSAASTARQQNRAAIFTS
jgi:hypothetical protein